MIRQRIREWLGIQDLALNQQMLYTEQGAANRKLTRIDNNLNMLGPGIARIIAKLDPNYGADEFSPERKAESDRITEENIRRLKAEAAARAPHNIERDQDIDNE